MAEIQDPSLIVQWKDETLPLPTEWKKQRTGLIALRVDDEGRKDVAKRSHDLTAGLRTLRFAIDSLRDGYRFDDGMATAKITAMEKAIANLEREVKVLSDLYQAYFDQTTSG